jgi:hypothetical protein
MTRNIRDKISSDCSAPCEEGNFASLVFLHLGHTDNNEVGHDAAMGEPERGAWQRRQNKGFIYQLFVDKIDGQLAI